MTTFAPAPALSSVTPLDPSKHVHFTRGMVLGVEDFTQEFEYLSRRDHWIVRELVGYGTVSGLRVSVDPAPAGEEERGPRIAVSPGVAVLPSGRLTCVSPAQCAFVGDWVASKRDEILAADGSPPGAEESPPAGVSAFVVLCHAECLTDDVPIPGEPCRSEENLMAPSRVKDFFALELRLEPPAMQEEEAVRWLGGWLAAVPVADIGSPLEDFLDELREAALGDASPAESPPDVLDPSPPAGLAIPRARVPEFLTAAFALWTAELRGRWRTPVPGCECAPGPGCPPEDDCLLLGVLDIPLTWDAITRDPVIGDADTIAVDLSERPMLLHQRLLQEWMLAGARDGGSARAVVRTTESPMRVEAERLEVVEVTDRVYHLVPDDFDPAAAYAVSGTGLAALNQPSVVLEQLDAGDPDVVTLLDTAGITAPGLTIRVQAADGTAAGAGFSVQIDPVGGTT
jgi:hypothetical protein